MSATSTTPIVKGTGAHHVIALNGWFGRAEDWGVFTDHLDMENFTWHFFEYRGYGARKNEDTGQYDLAEISREVTEYIGGLGVAKLSLLGHSMGTVFMQRILLDSPVEITALVGISAVPASGTPLDEQSRALFESAATQEASRRTIIDFTSGSHLPDSWLDQMAADSMAHSTPEAVRNYLLAWADADFAAELGTQDLPVLILTGANDPAATSDFATDTYGQIYPNLTVEELPDTGHYPMFEHPLSLTTKVVTFLRSV
ncbi:alpha/beta fold hydrolase [uncultured Corynebacterium sp.]|uniref:alpha/beta fold hydrolase n=1 Tax=uncultured Corynebacterium sp. TaxID=159447 RepID=UPI0025DB86CE|nr:alpha/beta hydrolase [uncultured Corynebacterium sp.]